MRNALGWTAIVAQMAVMAATPAHAETLTDAIAAAYRTNPLLQAQRADARAVDEELTQAKAAYGPTLTARASRTYSYQRANLTAGPTSEGGTTNSYTGTADQPLFTSGRLSSGIRVARANIDVARENLRQVEANVLNTVITAYVSVRRDQQLLAIANENLDLLARQRSDTADRLKGREATATDLDQTQVRYNFALARVKDATASLEVSRSQYLQSVGILPGDLAPMPILAVLPASLDQAYDVADENSPQLLAAMGRERASHAQIGGARAELGPIVSLQANGGRGTLNDFTTTRRDYFSGGIVATMPIFNSGLTASRIRQAQKRNDSDWYAVDQTRRDVRQAVAQSWERMVSARGSVGDYRTAVTRAEAAFSGARAQERAGVRTTLDVLDQARDLLDARTALAQTEANEYLTRTSLLATMGLLEAPRLTAVEAYDPGVNLRRVQNVLVPPYQPILHGADAVLQGPVKDRPTRDAAAAIRKPSSGPLPPEPDVSAVK